MKDKTKITRISDKEPSLEKLQKLVGGYIEVAYDDGKTQIICYEEGQHEPYTDNHLTLMQQWSGVN